MEVLRLFCLLVAMCRIGHSSGSYYLLESLMEDLFSMDSTEDSYEEDTPDVEDKDKEYGEWLSRYCDYLYDVMGITLLQETADELVDALSDFGIESETQVERPYITHNASVSVPGVVLTDIHETPLNSGPSTVELPTKPPTSSVNKPLFATSLLIPTLLPPGLFLPTNETTDDSLTIALASDLVDDTN